jgi:hypothetical protein
MESEQFKRRDFYLPLAVSSQTQKKKKKKKKPIFPYNNTSVAEHDAVYLVQFLQTPPHQGRGSHWSSASNPKTHTRALGVIFRSKSRFSQTIYFPPNKSI